jgi:hypothetical protein
MRGTKKYSAKSLYVSLIIYFTFEGSMGCYFGDTKYGLSVMKEIVHAHLKTPDDTFCNRANECRGRLRV